MPDRLPSLIVLVGFWIPPAVAGWVAAGATIATPRAVAWLAVVTSVLVLPGSALACALAFRRRGRILGRPPGTLL